MRKLFTAAVAALALAQVASAQTNLQLFYDFGADRKLVTATLEGFYGDSWGNTFFFVDYDFSHKANGGTKAPSGTYTEIARCFNFWQDTKLGALSLQLEYNGGVYRNYFINHSILAGVDYFLHSADFRNTFNLKLLYRRTSLATAVVPLQFTFVWGMQDLFDVKGLRFSGFVDIWGENTVGGEKFIAISEPQLWYNVGRHIGVDNLNVGGEVELSCNFAGSSGFRVRPCLGAKWVF